MLKEVVRTCLLATGTGRARDVALPVAVAVSSSSVFGVGKEQSRQRWFAICSCTVDTHAAN